jgi:subtilisin family serine protease
MRRGGSVIIVIITLLFSLAAPLLGESVQYSTSNQGSTTVDDGFILDISSESQQYGADLQFAESIMKSTTSIEQVQISPSLQWWTEFGDGLVEPMVLTYDLANLDEWQRSVGYPPTQAEAAAGQQLLNAEPSRGILEHRSIEIPGRLVAKLVAVTGVAGIYRLADELVPSSLDDEFSEAEFRGASVRAGQLHGANEVWSEGVNGSGVTVAVADSGIDFAHPDLNGTQARIDNASSPYDGWPLMHDPVSIRLWLRDGAAYPGSEASWWSDTTETDFDANNDSILDNNSLDLSSITPSLSGVYHIGEHPDSNLVVRAGGAVPVLVVDDRIAGVYETVYVDTDRDGNLSEEQPMRRGAETAGLDTDGDGLWDRSAGLLWWISDGSHGVPYGDIYAARNGYQNRIAGSGDLVLFMINDAREAGGNHGTLCASAIAAQGEISNGAVLGMAPGSNLTAVSNLYGGGSWFDSWRFIAEGYDGNVSTPDQPQIGSFSFGVSQAHDDGADGQSLYLDWLTRVYNPQTTYLVAVGNGGPGYGTTASPGGAHGIISVGAFSSQGGQSNGGTFGESAMWTNRGPNSVSRLDPDIVAVGWSATGDRTLNEVTNANSARRSWGGTSLATPIAAGLTALVYQAYFDEYGTWPDSQTVRDLIMSTADDRGYDPLVQGAGWFNVSRTVGALTGENGSMTVSPAAWMTGGNHGAHRDANLNAMRPGQNQTVQIQLDNPGSTDLILRMNGTTHEPLLHNGFVWNSTDQGANATWDGYQSGTPDFVIPLYIAGDANYSLPNGTDLLRARAVMAAEGFDGNQNYQSENRVYLRMWRWTDNDGDGIWHNDSNSDYQVDAGEWTENNNEFAMLTEHTYASPQVEVRLGKPFEQADDGILLAVWREEIRTSQVDPLKISVDWTAFGRVTDSWISAPSNLMVPANSSISTNITISVPADERGGIKQHGVSMKWLEIDSNQTIINGSDREWVWPVITNVMWQGPFTAFAKPIDGNMSNQTLYDETWLQGAQRWGWRSESGDWKFLTIDWPTSLNENGSILVDVDWGNNSYTDVDIHWMSEQPHGYNLEDPAAYGPYTFGMETGSTNKDRGSGIYGYETSTGSSHEFLVAEATPGLKQMMLHSAMHGVSTNDNPLNISVGYIAPVGGGLSKRVTDWSNAAGNESVQLVSTMAVEIAAVDAYGWSEPILLPSEIITQDVPSEISSSSYQYPFSVQTGTEQLSIEIGGSAGNDLDLYVYRDKNSNGIIDWSSEQVGSSGNWNDIESISLTNPTGGDHWVVVHGYDVVAGNASFWLRISSVVGTDLQAGGFYSIEQNAINTIWQNGSQELAGAIPTSAWQINLSYSPPLNAGIWSGWLEVELLYGGQIRIPYEYILEELPPELEFVRPDNNSQSNESVSISLNARDYGAGFKLSGLNLISLANTSHPSNLTVICQLSNGSIVNRTVQWSVAHGFQVGNQSENLSYLENETLRSAWLNWTLPDVNGWYEWSANVLDVSGRWNETGLRIRYDDVLPIISLHDWRFITHENPYEITIQTEPGARLWLNGSEILVAQDGSVEMALDLHPSFFKTDDGWLYLNTFNLTAIDGAGNVVNLTFNMAFDPWPASNDGLPSNLHQLKLLGFDSDEPPEPDILNPDNLATGVNISSGEVDVQVIIDTRSFCLRIENISGDDLSRACHDIENPPWDDSESTHVRLLANIPELLTFSLPIDLEVIPDGAYTIRLRAWDWAGNVGDATWPLIIDRTAPTLDWNSPENESKLPHHIVSLNWTVDEEVIWMARLNGEVVEEGFGFGADSEIVLQRTGSHELCLQLVDRTSPQWYPNQLVVCRNIELNESLYEPTVEALWNNSVVNTTSVSLQLTRGPLQGARLFLISGNNTSNIFMPVNEMFNIEILSISFDLTEGENRFTLEVDALERVYVFELLVTLDTIAPNLTITRPMEGTSTFAARMNIEGACQPDLVVVIEVGGINSSAICRPTGLYEIGIELPNGDGLHIVIVTSKDVAGNKALVSRLFRIDSDAPNALLQWMEVSCPTGLSASLIGDVEVEPCSIRAELMIEEDDVVKWSAELSRDGVTISTVEGDGPTDSPVFVTCDLTGQDCVPGKWAIDLWLEDAAGNRQLQKIEFDLSQPNPTLFESAVEPGSTMNIGLILAVLLLVLLTTIMMRRRGEEVLSSEDIKQIHDSVWSEFDDV